MLKRRRKRLAVTLLLLFALGVGALVFINANLRPGARRAFGGARAVRRRARAMNDAILEVLREEEAGYGALVNVYENNGKVLPAAGQQRQAQHALGGLRQRRAGAHRGAGRAGRLHPAGARSPASRCWRALARASRCTSRRPARVHASFESEFRSAGINQTLHRVNLHLTAHGARRPAGRIALAHRRGGGARGGERHRGRRAGRVYQRRQRGGSAQPRARGRLSAAAKLFARKFDRPVAVCRPVWYNGFISRSRKDAPCIQAQASSRSLRGRTGQPLCKKDVRVSRHAAGATRPPSNFSEGNIFVRVNESIRDKDVYIVQPIGHEPNDEFTELLFWIDAFKRASANSVTAIIPYFFLRQGR